jgi:hypothetical protein
MSIDQDWNGITIMSTRGTSADRLAASIVGLRNARARLTGVPTQFDRVTVKAQIDICDELISRVGEIDKSLRELSSQSECTPMARADRESTSGCVSAYRDDVSPSETNV